MITLRKSEDRGHANHGWLDAYHTFSFGQYRDRRYMGYKSLRVINEDRVAPNQGFGTHPHDNMEIITYVVDGELEHKDSMGNGSVIEAGQFQVITAGSGITHSEFNPSSKSQTHLYQIWIVPEERGLEPAYSQKSFTAPEQLQLVVSKSGESGSLIINQDVKLYRGVFTEGDTFELPLAHDRFGWLQVVKGQLEIEENLLEAGDGASIENLSNPVATAVKDVELLFFDLQ